VIKDGGGVGFMKKKKRYNLSVLNYMVTSNTAIFWFTTTMGEM